MRRLALILLPALLLALSSEGAAAQGGTSAATACNKAAIYSASTAGATQLVAAGTGIQICGYTIWTAGTTNVSLVFGTGTNCATGTTNVTPAFVFASTTGTGIVDSSPYYRGLNAPSGNALCINSSAGVAVQAIVHYNN